MDRTVLLHLHYDGARFAGWQRQPESRTVQGELEAVLARLCGGPVPAHAAGRTDAGVHALGMAVSFTVTERWTPAALRRGLNALLPSDCWVERAIEVGAGFHARKSAGERSYRYLVGTDQAARSPFRRPFEWALGRPLDLDCLHRVSAGLLGEHDFRSLAVQTGAKLNCRCELRVARWSDRAVGSGVQFEVSANRFLHHMVRMLVGTMVDMALGHRPEEDMTRLLALDPEVRSSPPAPAEGLYFVKADYPSRWFMEPPTG